jgi:hypothetical protein
MGAPSRRKDAENRKRNRGISNDYASEGVRYLFRKFASLERELKGRLDVQESAIIGILQRLLDILDPPRLPVPQPRRSIGFCVEDRRPRYCVRRVSTGSRAWAGGEASPLRGHGTGRPAGIPGTLTGQATVRRGAIGTA